MPTILLIEDEPLLREAAEEILEVSGCGMVRASNGLLLERNMLETSQ